jgi:hydrogenase maturation factor
MNLVTGRITEIYVEGGTTRAKVSVGGAQFRVMMTLLMDAHVGDNILIDSGVAISTVQPIEAKEVSHVLGDSR